LTAFETGRFARATVFYLGPFEDKPRISRGRSDAISMANFVRAVGAGPPGRMWGGPDGGTGPRVGGPFGFCRAAGPGG